MSTPFYVSPEQLMKDRADFARQGIARGRSVLVASCQAGIVLLAHNPSATLHKIAELYDRIGFAAVGKYNEFETLRQAGVRFADLRGYSYDRRDVTAASIVGAYAQTLAGVFTTESKPFEVELIVAELGDTPAADGLFRVSYDGSVTDDSDFAVVGGDATAVVGRLHELSANGTDMAKLDLAGALRVGVDALGGSAAVDHAQLEAAVLDRSATGRRRFSRLSTDRIAELLEED